MNNIIKKIEYNASPTGELFHNSSARIRGLRGPVGSGKSVTCCFELFKMGMEQKPNAQGIRPTRMVVVRNTFPELKTTTIKTWTGWFPSGKTQDGGVGILKWGSPIVHQVRLPLPDGTEMHMDVEFMALDDAKDVKKLLSYEFTAGWVNEAREINKPIIDGMTQRIGRFPSLKADGVACTRKAVIMDTNPPADSHWWFDWAEGETPEGMEFFKQPGGLDDKGENLENLNQGEFERLYPDKKYEALTLEERRHVGRLYYKDMMGGKSVDWVNVYVHGQYGFIKEGEGVYENEWNPQLHVADRPIPIHDESELYVGVDSSGRHPAAIFLQRTAFGQWQAVYEIVFPKEGISAENFAALLLEEIQLRFRRYQIVNPVWGDPAGAAKGRNDDRTYFDILNGKLKLFGLRSKPSPGVTLAPRIETVKGCLTRLVNGGEPKLLVSPTCKHLIQGFNGGYHYKEMNSTGEPMFNEKPVKNRFSDIHDALQYVLCGVGELRQTLSKGGGTQKTRVMDDSWSPYDSITGTSF